MRGFSINRVICLEIHQGDCPPLLPQIFETETIWKGLILYCETDCTTLKATSGLKLNELILAELAN